VINPRGILGKPIRNDTIGLSTNFRPGGKWIPLMQQVWATISPSQRRSMPERHKFVLDANCARIADAYLAALRRGDDRPVIAVIDNHDPSTRQMVLDLDPRDLDCQANDDDGRAEIDAGSVWAIPHDLAMDRLGDFSPKSRESIEQLTALDLIPVVVITDGLLFWAGLPKPYLEPPRRTVWFSEN
jgi:hypothetical protein